MLQKDIELLEKIMIELTILNKNLERDRIELQKALFVKKFNEECLANPVLSIRVHELHELRELRE